MYFFFCLCDKINLRFAGSLALSSSTCHETRCCLARSNRVANGVNFRDVNRTRLLNRNGYRHEIRSRTPTG